MSEVHPPQEFPLCSSWAKEILIPFRRKFYGAVDQSDLDRIIGELEQAIYEALVEACQRGTPLPYGYIEDVIYPT